MARPVRALPITAEQRGPLQRLVQRPTATQREVRRAQIILSRADGLSQTDTARRVGVNRPVVVLWERRFGAAGLAGLADAKGRGRKPSVALETKSVIVSRATQPRRPGGRVGRCGRWPRLRACRRRPCSGCGPPTPSSRI